MNLNLERKNNSMPSVSRPISDKWHQAVSKWEKNCEVIWLPSSLSKARLSNNTEGNGHKIRNLEGNIFQYKVASEDNWIMNSTITEKRHQIQCTAPCQIRDHPLTINDKYYLCNISLSRLFPLGVGYDCQQLSQIQGSPLPQVLRPKHWAFIGPCLIFLYFLFFFTLLHLAYPGFPPRWGRKVQRWMWKAIVI